MLVSLKSTAIPGNRKKIRIQEYFVTKCKRGGIDTKRVNPFFTLPVKILALKQGMQKLPSARRVGR